MMGVVIIGYGPVGSPHLLDLSLEVALGGPSFLCRHLPVRRYPVDHIPRQDRGGGELFFAGSRHLRGGVVCVGQDPFLGRGQLWFGQDWGAEIGEDPPGWEVAHSSGGGAPGWRALQVSHAGLGCGEVLMTVLWTEV